MKSYRAYLFDADGTLFDTAEMIYRCFVYSCGKYGNRQITRAEVNSGIGLPLAAQFTRYLGPVEPQLLEHIMADHMDYQLSIYPRYLKAFPGVRETLHELQAGGAHLAVVTSRKITSLTRYLRETGLREFFSVLVTPDETTRHKPDPEPVLKALELLGARSGDAVFVGDAAFDVECGSRAGVDTVFVTWSNTPVSALPVQPTACIDDMRELLPDNAGAQSPMQRPA